MIKNFSNLIMTAVLLFMLVLSCMRILTYYHLFHYANYLWAILAVFFLAITILTLLVMRIAKKKGSKRFLYTFLGVSGGKPLVYATIILIYGLRNPEDLTTFALTFVAYYVIFTIFEVWAIIKLNKENL